MNGASLLLAVVLATALVHKVIVPVMHKLYRLDRIEKHLSESTIDWMVGKETMKGRKNKDVKNENRKNDSR